MRHNASDWLFSLTSRDRKSQKKLRHMVISRQRLFRFIDAVFPLRQWCTGWNRARIIVPISSLMFQSFDNRPSLPKQDRVRKSTIFRSCRKLRNSHKRLGGSVSAFSESHVSHGSIPDPNYINATPLPLLDSGGRIYLGLARDRTVNHRGGSVGGDAGMIRPTTRIGILTWCSGI
jgi:hypothetical protein